jgi:hypothetical protein
MKLVTIKNLITQVTYQTVNKVNGMQLKLSAGSVMRNGKVKFGSPSGVMSIPNFITVLCVCALVQRT